MKNFFAQLPYKIGAFMVGRRGMDNLNVALLVASVICMVLEILFGWRVLSWISFVLLSYAACAAIPRILPCEIERIKSGSRHRRSQSVGGTCSTPCTSIARPRNTSGAKGAGKSSLFRATKARCASCARSAKPRSRRSRKAVSRSIESDESSFNCFSRTLAQSRRVRLDCYLRHAPIAPMVLVTPIYASWR